MYFFLFIGLLAVIPIQFFVYKLLSQPYKAWKKSLSSPPRLSLLSNYSPEKYLDLRDKFNLMLEPTLEFSLVVPAFNEETRIGQMLEDHIEFLESRKKLNTNFTYEIIVVDDGSKDNT